MKKFNNGGIANNPNTAIGTEIISKTYFQSDILGSILFISNDKGQVLRYIERDPCGNTSIPLAYDMNIACLENSDIFTNHSYDRVLDKYFAQARFYDPSNGRMMSIDPINTGTNLYIYSYNNPINYTDPTGETPSIIAGALIGVLVGGVVGFAGSTIGQLASKQKFSVKKALGSAVQEL
jgi:RHS repeat-associated protein